MCWLISALLIGIVVALCTRKAKTRQLGLLCSFCVGCTAHSGLMMAMSDVMGREAYAQYCLDNWIEMSPAWGIGMMVFSVIMFASIFAMIRVPEEVGTLKKLFQHGFYLSRNGGEAGGHRLRLKYDGKYYAFGRVPIDVSHVGFPHGLVTECKNCGGRADLKVMICDSEADATVLYICSSCLLESFAVTEEPVEFEEEHECELS